ncbi:MAG: WhiB family transcriptional regulator [Acidimicrobiales bacterium]
MLARQQIAASRCISSEEEALGADHALGREGLGVAACQSPTGSMLELFFSDSISEISRAKEICGGCGRRPSCLQGATERGEPAGVWGGELFANGHVLHNKRPRGRPRRNGLPGQL